MQKYIYKIKNLINGKEYYGQTVHPEKRWWEHRRKAITHADNYPIHLAIAKYGEENFSFELLEKTEDYDEEEKRFIRENNSRVPNGYNVAEGGSSYVSYGQENARNTVRDADVPKIIKDLKENKLTDRQIAKKYNSTDKIISDINHGRTHRIDGEKYPLRVKRGSQKMTEKQADEIKDLLRSTDLKTYTDAGRIIFTAYKKQEFGDLGEDDSINFTPLWAISYNPDDYPDDLWKWHMSVGFAKWLQEEHDDANFPKETFIWRK